MNRKLPNWIDGFLEYVDDTESALIYKKWVAFSVIASVLRRKVKFALGRIDVFPNMYVVLVGPPGARKTAAIKFGHYFLKKLDIAVSADCITRERLIQDLEKVKKASPMGGAQLDHCSMTVFSSELETFLGSKADNIKMLMTLTDLWDCPDKWEYKTKGSGENEIVNVYINLIGATTPSSIASSIPPGAIGSGFTSRIVFCHSDTKHKKQPIPRDTKRIQALRASLLHDLGVISNINGVYHFTGEGEKFWHDWYMTYDDQGVDRPCKDPMFNGWYERKSMFVLKLSMILAAATDASLVITPAHMEKALAFLEEVEHTMGKSFRTVGRSIITNEIDIVFSLIKQHKVIQESKLLDIAWRDLGGRKFFEIMDTAVKTGKIKREWNHPQHRGELVYVWTGNEEDY